MIDKTWLNEYIEQMEYEVRENEKRGTMMQKVMAS